MADEYKAEVRARRAALTEEQQTEQKQFTRGRWVADAGAMQHVDERRKEVVRRAAPKRLAKMGMLKIENSRGFMETEDREVTDRVKQQDIVNAVDTQTQRKKFEITLDKLGPYAIDYTRNGTHLAIAGLRGHLASFNWKTFGLEGEVQLKDRCSDVKFLVDHSMMAVAQKRFVYMYSKDGVEMHVLPNMANVDRLEFLHRHMLLVGSSSQYSVLHYMDISTGQPLTSKGPAVMKDPAMALKQNPANGIVTTGDLRGIVKFWSPSAQEPLVQLKAHKGAIQDIAFHQNGRFFVSLGTDHKMKVWDSRTMRTLDEYAVTYCFDTIDISYSGLVAMGGGTNVQVWNHLFSPHRPSGPYMKHGLGYGNIAAKVRFCPFEDILGIGHSKGFTSIIVPGSGEANPDFYYANPHETEMHRKERVVKSLLDKLPPDTIAMDLELNGVDTKRLELYNANIAAARKSRNIREKKKKPAPAAADASHKTGLVGDDDELDEELGFVHKAPVEQALSKKDLQKQRKMKKWDKKDTVDKVRSKQKMRQSKVVARQRGKIERNEKRAARAAKEEQKSGNARGGAAATPAAGSGGSNSKHIRFADADDYETGGDSSEGRVARSGGEDIFASADRKRHRAEPGQSTNAAFARFAK